MFQCGLTILTALTRTSASAVRLVVAAVSICSGCRIAASTLVRITAAAVVVIAVAIIVAVRLTAAAWS